MLIAAEEADLQTLRVGQISVNLIEIYLKQIDEDIIAVLS